MEVYRTEQEQIEAIKKFFNTHGNKLLAGIVLFIAAFAGYHYWSNEQKSSAEEASVVYSQLRELARAGETGVSEESRAGFDRAYARLMEEYPESVYASYASLLKARLDVDAKQYDKAAQALQWVVDAAATAEITALANLRLARVLFAKGENESALGLLDKQAEPFAAAYEELRGDIYLEQGSTDKALESFRKAKELFNGEAGVSGAVLDMKINSLSPIDPAKLVPLPAGKQPDGGAADKAVEE